MYVYMYIYMYVYIYGLNVWPEQRGYVWKAERASRLIVTALCNRIVPGIVLHEKTKGVYEV